MSTQEGVKEACLPCGIGHFSGSAGLLNEAYRFRHEGLTSPQVLNRIAKAIEEQNALERVDLTPEKIRDLPDWEKALAEEASIKSRELRHKLETIENIEDLEDLAADTEEFYKYLYREWTTKRLETCPTCQINTDEAIAEAEEEVEEKVKVKVEAPKNRLEEYGRKASEARRALLEEIHQARSK